MRRDAKVDACQPYWTKALRSLGFLVKSTAPLGAGVPDIIVSGTHRGFDAPLILWLEIKMPLGKLTPKETEFHSDWKGHPILATCFLSDVLRWYEWTKEDIDLALTRIRRELGDVPDDVRQTLY